MPILVCAIGHFVEDSAGAFLSGEEEDLEVRRPLCHAGHTESFEEAV